MDLNQLYFDHQISLMQADAAECSRLRLLHHNNALAIARRVACIHRDSGARAVRGWVQRSRDNFQGLGCRSLRAVAIAR